MTFFKKSRAKCQRAKNVGDTTSGDECSAQEGDHALGNDRIHVFQDVHFLFGSVCTIHDPCPLIIIRGANSAIHARFDNKNRQPQKLLVATNVNFYDPSHSDAIAQNATDLVVQKHIEGEFRVSFFTDDGRPYGSNAQLQELVRVLTQ